jgi:predicted adenylyl cyclase CyaB
MENIEVELKFPLLNHEDAIERLKHIAKLVLDEEYQKDTYYIPSHRNFILSKPISEWLRIRETKEGFHFNYKKWHLENNFAAVSCDEFQTNFENLSALKNILSMLDFKEIIIVEKSRSTWNYKNVKISVDEVTELGYFIELEADGNFDDIEKAKEHLYNLLNELNIRIGEQNFKGYPYLLLERKGLIN